MFPLVYKDTAEIKVLFAILYRGESSCNTEKSPLSLAWVDNFGTKNNTFSHWRVNLCTPSMLTDDCDFESHKSQNHIVWNALLYL